MTADALPGPLPSTGRTTPRTRCSTGRAGWSHTSTPATSRQSGARCWPRSRGCCGRAGRRQHVLQPRELVEDERSGNRDVEAGAHAQHRDLNGFVEQVGYLVGQPCALMAQQHHRSTPSRNHVGRPRRCKVLPRASTPGIHGCRGTAKHAPTASHVRSSVPRLASCSGHRGAAMRWSQQRWDRRLRSPRRSFGLRIRTAGRLIYRTWPAQDDCSWRTTLGGAPDHRRR